MGNEKSWAETRLNLLKDFNLAGSEGAKNWHRFIQRAQQAGFSELDFQSKLQANRGIVRQWTNPSCESPGATMREHHRTIIVGVLSERLYGRNPAFGTAPDPS